jgi:streptogrisin C
MFRKLAVIAAAVVVPAGIVAIAIMPADALQTPSAAPAVAADAASAQMLSAMQRDLGLSATEARSRLVREASANRVEARLRKALGRAYAGSWLSTDAAALTVAVTDRAKAAEVRAAGAQATVVSRSTAALDKIKAALDAKAKEASAGGVPGWYVDVRDNAVVVLARGDKAAAREFIEAAGVADSAVRVVATKDQYRPFHDVRGGDPYFIGTGGRCSVGFSVSGGFVTAGHCGRTGATTSGFNRVSQGTFRGSSFPGNDYAWVGVNSQWTPKPWVKHGNANDVVAGSTEAQVGSSVCRSGSTTGWHCGTIQAKNATVNYPQGTVNGLTRTNVCAEPGDSGGSWISGQQAQGVTSGGSGDCTRGGTTFFQPLNEILSTYELTLTTSGGGPTPPPPPPPPGGCGDHEQKFTGSLSSGANGYQPPNGYRTTRFGTHKICLDGPNGADFDIYLQKASLLGWTTVARGATEDADEELTYNGTAGTYRVRVHAYDGSGSYTLGITSP